MLCLYITFIAVSAICLCQPPDFNFASHFKLPYHGTLKFAVYLEYRGQFVCSGVIVGDKWVLTAANCLHRDGRQFPDHAVSVIAGCTTYKNVHSSNVYHKQERTAKKILIHPDYVNNYFSKSDLALVQVNETFNFTQTSVSKINISRGHWPEENNRSRTCMSFGFGDFGPGAPNSQLKLWNSTALHGPQACPCTKRFQWQRLVCREETEGIGLCEGDTGGGLVCYNGTYPVFPDEDPGLMEVEDVGLEHKLDLVGIAHMTMDKFMCEYRHVPKGGCSKIPPISTYMFLCPFNDWISDHVPDTPPTPVMCGSPPRCLAPLVLLIAWVVWSLLSHETDRLDELYTN